jgi:hypothetical protein
MGKRFTGITFEAVEVENDSITVYAYGVDPYGGANRVCIGEVLRIMTPDRDDKVARAALGRIGDVVAAIQKVRPDFEPFHYTTNAKGERVRVTIPESGR